MVFQIKPNTNKKKHKEKISFLWKRQGISILYHVQHTAVVVLYVPANIWLTGLIQFSRRCPRAILCHLRPAQQLPVSCRIDFIFISTDFPSDPSQTVWAFVWAVQCKPSALWVDILYNSELQMYCNADATKLKLKLPLLSLFDSQL